jgi:hypothetical protein
MYEKPLDSVRFDGFDSNNTWEKLWHCAEEARDEYFEGHGLHYGSLDESYDLDEIVTNACDGKFMFQKDALELIAYYGTFDAMRGQDYEDSPREKFENDVFELAEELIYKTINA